MAKTGIRSNSRYSVISAWLADGEIDHKLFTISSLAGTCKKFLHCEPLELDVSDETLANYELMAGVESKLLDGCLGLSS